MISACLSGVGGETELCVGGEGRTRRAAVFSEGAQCVSPAGDKADGAGARGYQDGTEGQVGQCEVPHHLLGMLLPCVKTVCSSCVHP